MIRILNSLFASMDEGRGRRSHRNPEIRQSTQVPVSKNHCDMIMTL
jgi:hypothetical protein